MFHPFMPIISDKMGCYFVGYLLGIEKISVSLVPLPKLKLENSFDKTLDNIMCVIEFSNRNTKLCVSLD